MQIKEGSEKTFSTTAHDNYVHEYAKGGIAGATLINGGAAVAVISQFARFDDMNMQVPVAIAMTFWTLGLISSAASWIIALGSSRHVSRAQQNGFEEAEELDTSDFLMHWGISSVVASIAFFALGVFILIGGFIGQDWRFTSDEILLNYVILIGAILFGLVFYYFVTKRFTKWARSRGK